MDGEHENEDRYPQFSRFKEKKGEVIQDNPPPPPGMVGAKLYDYARAPEEQSREVSEGGGEQYYRSGPGESPPKGIADEARMTSMEPQVGSGGDLSSISSEMSSVPSQGLAPSYVRSEGSGRGGARGFEERYVDVPDAIRITQRTARKLIAEVKTAILGKGRVLELVCAGLLSSGNILFEDFPGLAKTLIARSFSRAIGCVYKRVQFTPDLLPADITGTYVFNRKLSEFQFKEGPIFTNILLADEINRAPPKTQAALLEAMEEKQVTVEGTTHILEKPFHVIATQNPIEYEGTYPLPEAQLDRFLMKLEVGYPDANTEISILNHRKLRGKDDFDIRTVTAPEEFTTMQKNIEKVFIDDSLIAYIVSIVRETRRHPDVKIGSSPRGALAMFKLSRAIAALQGRDYVVPDDVKKIVVPALEHRLILKPEPKIKGIRSRDIVIEIVENIPVPLA